MGLDDAHTSAGASYVERLSAHDIELSYAHYSSSDPLCCPSLTPIEVRFYWNGTKVVPLDTVPSEASRGAG